MSAPEYLLRPFLLAEGPDDFPSRERAELAARHIAEALREAGGTHELMDVVNAIDSRAMQLWLGERSTVVTQLVKYPRLQAVELFAAGGDLDELVAFVPQISAAARAAGATRLQMGGRRGWERVAERLGWRKQFHAYKELANA